VKNLPQICAVVSEKNVKTALLRCTPFLKNDVTVPLSKLIAQKTLTVLSNKIVLKQVSKFAINVCRDRPLLVIFLRVSVQNRYSDIIFTKCLIRFSRKRQHESATIFHGLDENTCYLYLLWKTLRLKLL